MNFSDFLFIKRITYNDLKKVYFIAIYNNNEYFVVGKYYLWLIENITIIGYGSFNKEKKSIYLEVIIPYLKGNKQFFYFFLINSNIPGLSKKKIDLLDNFFGDSLPSLFFDNKFNEINKVIKYEDEKLTIIIKKWTEIGVYSLLFIDLLKLGISAKFIKKIYKVYRENAINIIKENPYQMIESVGFGFKTVDAIAMEYGIQSDNILRIMSAFLYILDENESEGNTFIIKDILYEKLKLLLNIDCLEIFDNAFIKLLNENKIIVINNFVGKYNSYYYENFIFNYFRNNKKEKINFFNVNNFLLSDEQKIAILGALQNQYSIITGSAGTGKSTVIKMLYDIQKNNNKKIIVLTPTGRASQRIKDIDCNINTMTIHKILCSVGFYFKEKQINHVVNNLDYDHVIIDEASMIDSFLLYSILKVIPNYCYITFLGDACQLPPIGLGSPFNLLIKYKFISIYYLTKIFRQKNASVLLNIAKKISDGICPKISSFNEEDCVFKVVKKEYIKNTLSEYINKYYDKNNNILNFQIITFLNRGICGVNNINLFIQNYIKEHFQSCLLLLLKKFYQYDRVVVLKNNYNLNIRNGEIGIIIDGNENELIVLFNDEKKIIFNENDIHLLQLAYAINIYKSQGSEFQNILILLYLEQYILLNKKALYTALTRAKKTAVIIGETKALYCAINNKNNCNRNTFLELFLEGN